MPIIFLPNKRHITSRYLGGLSAYIKYSRKCVCGLFNCAFAGRFICFPWRNCFSVYLAKQKINHAFDTSLNIRELAPEETTFQEYSKVTSFQTVAVNSYFLLKVPVGPRPNIFCDRNHRTLFPLYNQLPKDLWLALKKYKNHHFVLRNHQLSCWNLPAGRHFLQPHQPTLLWNYFWATHQTQSEC